MHQTPENLADLIVLTIVLTMLTQNSGQFWAAMVMAMRALLFALVAGMVRGGSIWWITDMHVDLDGDSYPDEAPKCAWTPPALMQSSLRKMAAVEAKPDMIIVSGDFVHFPPRNSSDITADRVVETLRQVTDWISKAFPGVPVFPCLGNHDFDPSNNWPEEKRARWLYEPLGAMWGPDGAGWLDATAAASVARNGGYGQAFGEAKLRVIAPNTNYWAWYNTFESLEQNATTSAADRHFQWFAEELTLAEANGEAVYVVGHHPPIGQDGGNAIDNFWPLNTMKYQTLAQKHKGRIRAHFYGHEHYDEWRVLRECAATVPMDGSSGVNSCGGDPFGVVFVAQCMSNCADPGVRLWKYDDATFDVTDYDQYLHPEGAPSKIRDDAWYHAYNFKETYPNMKDLSPASFQAETDRLAANATLFDAFMARRVHTTGVDPSTCGGNCRTFQLCNMAYGSYAEFLQCAFREYK